MPRPCSRPSSASKMPAVSFLRGRRKGGLLVIVAAAMTVLIGFGALVCDVGLAFAQRTRMQTAADAAALAAASVMDQSQSRARLEAITIAKLNGYQIQGTDIDVDQAAKQVTVHWIEPTGFVLGPVLNRFGVNVGVSASATMEKTGQRLSLVPFLVIRTCDVKKGDWIKVKVGGGDGTTGNFGAGAIDGPGAKVYQDGIVHGAHTPIQIGSFVDFEPGDMVGPTDAGVKARIGDDDTPFESIMENTSSPRLITVPLVGDYTQGSYGGRSKPIMIRGFARLYLVGSQGGVVQARWIDENMLSEVPNAGEKPRPKLVR